MRWPRFLLSAAVGALLGGSAAAVLAADPQDAQRLANDLVPDSAQVVQVSENTGHPWVAGGYFIRVEAEGATRDELLARAEAVDADIDQIQVLPGGVEVVGHRGRVELDVTLQPPAFASVEATPTGPSVLLYGLGGAATAIVATAVLRRRKPRGRRGLRALPDEQPTAGGH